MFYDNLERNDLLLIWLHGGMAVQYSDPLKDQLVASVAYFQDAESRAFAEAGIDVLEPVSFSMNWTDKGHWVFDIISDFNVTARGYRMVALGGDSGGGTVVANVIAHYASQASVVFNRAVLVAPAIDFQTDGIFGVVTYASEVRVNSILGIHGTDDTTVPPTQSEDFFAGLPSFIQANLQLVDGATHITIMAYATPLIIAFIVPPKIDTELTLFADATTVNATAGQKINMIIVIVSLPDRVGLAGVPVEIDYRRDNSSSWVSLTTLMTDQIGQIACGYQPTASGLPYIIELRAFYGGNATFSGSESAVHSSNVVPEFGAFAPFMLPTVMGLLVLLRRRA